MRIGDGAEFNESPLYVMPKGGLCPAYVADIERRIIGVGCKSMTFKEWSGDKGQEAASKEWRADAVSKVYGDAIRFIAQQMGWD